MIGQTMEASMWYKTNDQREAAKEYIRAAFDKDAREHGIVFDTIDWYDADLSNDRSPKPPEEGAKLLVGEAQIIGLEPTRGELFLTNLGQKDLEILRKVTQDAWLKTSDKPLPLDELDRVIADTAPDVMEKMLEWGHERGFNRTH